MDLICVLGSVGPISVAVDSTDFRQYGGGIFNDDDCNYDPDHAVLVVGYGTLGKDDYWIVKNSWGTRWGESGYIRMSRNTKNQCSIASNASYPVLV